MEEEKELHPLLNAFKERMRIFHNGDDANLSRMFEFFYGNFQGDLMALSLENYKLEDKND